MEVIKKNRPRVTTGTIQDPLGIFQSDGPETGHRGDGRLGLPTGEKRILTEEKFEENNTEPRKKYTDHIWNGDTPGKIRTRTM